MPPRRSPPPEHGRPGRDTHNTIATADTTLPSKGEAAELVPPEEGVTRRIVGDARLFAGSGYALLLQVTHPTVGAGVSQHSNFKRDPWGRLLRTLDYTTAVTYGGPDLAWEVGRRVRVMHGRITGVRADGERYHAVDPEPWAWVHATLAESIVHAHRLFCSPRLGPSELEEFWREWRRMGRLVGVRYEDLPESWPGLLAYFDEMVRTRLEDTEAAQDVIAALADPASRCPGCGAQSGGLCAGRRPPPRSWRRWGCCRPCCASASGSPGALRRRSAFGRWQGSPGPTPGP